MLPYTQVCEGGVVVVEGANGSVEGPQLPLLAPLPPVQQIAPLLQLLDSSVVSPVKLQQ